MNDFEGKTLNENLNLNYEALILYDAIFNLIVDKNKKITTIPPFIKTMFINNLEKNDTKMAVILDHSNIIQFIKPVPQKSENSVIKHTCFCIARHFCHYLHFETGEVISNNIYELLNVDPEYVSSIAIFILNGEEISLEDFTEENIEHIKIFSQDGQELTLISELDDINLFTKVGYYIKHKNLNYVHCFMKESGNYKTNNDEKLNFNDINEIINNEDVELNDVLTLILEEIETHNTYKKMISKIGLLGGKVDTSVQINNQGINISVATYMSYTFLPWVFNFHK